MLVWGGASNIFVTTCLQHMLLDILYLWLFVYESGQREPSYIGSFYWKTLKPDTDNGKMKTENMVVGSHEWGLVVFSQWSPIPRSYFLLSLVFLRANPLIKSLTYCHIRICFLSSFIHLLEWRLQTEELKLRVSEFLLILFSVLYLSLILFHLKNNHSFFNIHTMISVYSSCLKLILPTFNCLLY